MSARTYDGAARTPARASPWTAAVLVDEVLARVGVEQEHADLAPVPLVDQARRIDQRDAVPRRQSGPWQDQAGVALGELDRDPRRDNGALARADCAALERVEVE